jgi:thymidine kinase
MGVPKLSISNISRLEGIGHARGSVEVIAGSMFSGKTEELIRLLRRAKYARQAIQVFKPRIDTRYSEDHVASHDRSLFPSIVIDRAVDIYRHLLPETQVVGIDEGQFFDDDLVDVANDLAARGLRLIVAGLDTDWRGEPFAPMPALMAIAESVTKLHAVCVVCGQTASRTQRKIRNNDAILVGDHLSYEARCRSCFDLDMSVEPEHRLSAERPFDEFLSGPSRQVLGSALDCNS